MNNFIFRTFLSVACLASILTTVSSNVLAAPVKINRVVQVVNAKPGRAATGSFSQLRLNEPAAVNNGGDEDNKKTDDDANKTAAPQQTGDRVIVETTTEVVQDEDCNCPDVPKVGGGFPKWALLGLAAVPLVFLIRHRDKDTPTPPPGFDTPTPPPTTPDSPTPPPTVPPEPVPEPMTILLFGTGLAGIGVAARKRFGKKDKKEAE